MRNIIFHVYNLYLLNFPINRGKQFIGKLIDKCCGTFLIQVDDFKLAVFCSSAMDMSYLENNDSGHDLLKEEINKLPKGAVFVDIGANIGYTSFYAAVRIGNEGKVYSFEPSFREYNRLLKGLVNNTFNNVIPFNVAIAASKGLVKVKTDVGHTGMNRIENNESRKEQLSSQNFLVPCFALGDLIAEERIDLVKIDVEGAEFQVLQGLEPFLKRKKIDRVIIEITPMFLKHFGDDKQDIYNLFSKYGYKSLINGDAWQYDEVFSLI